MVMARVVGGAGDAAASSLAISFSLEDDGGIFSSVRAPSPPAFVTVDLVLAASGAGAVDALPHVSALIKAFLDVSPVSSVSVAAASCPLRWRDDARVWLRRAADREALKLSGWSSELQRAYKQHQFATAANILAARGDTAALRWLWTAYNPKGRFEGAERAALWHGQLHVLRFLQAECFQRAVEDATPLQDAIARAAALGRDDLVAWVVEAKGAPAVGWGAMDAACAHDRMALVRFLFERVGNRCTRRGLELAARHGHLAVVMWLHEHRHYEVRTFRTLENAVRGGHLVVAQFILRHVPVARHSWTQDARSAAVRFGQRDILDWIDRFALQDLDDNHIENRNRSDDDDEKPKPYKLAFDALQDAARDGHLDVIRWLYARGHLHDEATATAELVRGAVDGGQQHVLEWTHDTFARVLSSKRVAGGWLCADGAAVHGRLGLLPFLGERRALYRFTNAAMDGAAANGHLEVVQWLHESDGTCSKVAMDQAATNGHLEIVRFLHDRRREGCSKLALDGAARNGHLQVVRFLLEHRGEGCSASVASGTYYVEVLECLRAHGRLRKLAADQWPRVEEAAARGDLPLLRWLLRIAPGARRQLARRSDSVLQAARDGHHFHVLRWLETLSSAFAVTPSE